ncbi:hypothetical protein OPQ81_011822, partial [Rhizoctonia solani]
MNLRSLQRYSGLVVRTISAVFQDGWVMLYSGNRSSVAKGRMNTNEGSEVIIIKNIRPGPDWSDEDAEKIIENELIVWNRLHDHPHIVAFLGLTHVKLDLDEMRG